MLSYQDYIDGLLSIFTVTRPGNVPDANALNDSYCLLSRKRNWKINIRDLFLLNKSCPNKTYLKKARIWFIKQHCIPRWHVLHLTNKKHKPILFWTRMAEMIVIPTLFFLVTILATVTLSNDQLLNNWEIGNMTSQIQKNTDLRDISFEHKLSDSKTEYSTLFFTADKAHKYSAYIGVFHRGRLVSTPVRLKNNVFLNKESNDNNSIAFAQTLNSSLLKNHIVKYIDGNIYIDGSKSKPVMKHGILRKYYSGHKKVNINVQPSWWAKYIGGHHITDEILALHGSLKTTKLDGITVKKNSKTKYLVMYWNVTDGHNHRVLFEKIVRRNDQTNKEYTDFSSLPIVLK